MCSVLTTLALDDEAALQIRKANGVYLLGKLLFAGEELLPKSGSYRDGNETCDIVGCGSAVNRTGSSGGGSRGAGGGVIIVHIFRTLRYVFSTERNRKVSPPARASFR